ncbi:MAG: hypothetical protein CEO19_388 [Parcubacteria group bacterium Gr01-1014_73]|nr:MAG: hypothetical protein CEO19_388 [Parcubacteria group bacterium Gr01-1014_73]
MTLTALIMTLIYFILLALVCWLVPSRASWKKKAAGNEGIFLVCYLPIGKEENYQEVSLKHFPGIQKTALDDAYDFLKRNAYEQINTASRAQVFARGNERVKIFFLNDGIVSETIL